MNFKGILLLRNIAIIFFLLVPAGCGLPRALILGPQPLVVEKKEYIVQPAPKLPNTPALNGKVALKSITQIRCISTGTVGTVFLHKSGNLLTAAHVIAGCPKCDIRIGMPSTSYSVREVIVDTQNDLALLVPDVDLGGIEIMLISKNDTLTYGESITTWGFPEGYRGGEPLLTVGYIAGYEKSPANEGAGRKNDNGLWYVNAAINGGLSGAPVVRLEDGTIIGVVSGKQQAGTPEIELAIEKLSSRDSEDSQLIAKALESLRQRTQYNLGYVIPASTVRAFLTKNGIEP